MFMAELVLCKSVYKSKLLSTRAITINKNMKVPRRGFNTAVSLTFFKKAIFFAVGLGVTVSDNRRYLQLQSDSKDRMTDDKSVQWYAKNSSPGNMQVTQSSSVPECTAGIPESHTVTPCNTSLSKM